MQGKTILRDTAKRAESPELRFKYVAKFEKLLRRPQASEGIRHFMAKSLPPWAKE